MRVVSWNMAYWQRRAQWREAWAFLTKELAPDIALLQEAVVPNGLDYEQFVTPALEGGTSLKQLAWGSAILSRVGQLELGMDISPELIAGRGAVQLANCNIDGTRPTTLVNIHSRLNYGGTQQVIPNLQETIDMVLPALG